MFSAKVIEYSISQSKVELITFQLVYPRFIHAEVMTHRLFSRNAMSSRAVPVAKMIEQIRKSPAMPVHWGANQPGMQAKAELEGEALATVKAAWLEAAATSADIAERMMNAGVHKQVANRILEPYQWMQTIVTATEWNNWNELRVHEDAEPNIFLLATLMNESRALAAVTLREYYPAQAKGWHLPYITLDEREQHGNDPMFLVKASAARCARVSYLTHDGSAPDLNKDLQLYDRLVGSKPLHASPVEHQAYPMNSDELTFSGNFYGWNQYRKMVERDMS